MSNQNFTCSEFVCFVLIEENFAKSLQNLRMQSSQNGTTKVQLKYSKDMYFC
jgi:hypothetical protein